MGKKNESLLEWFMKKILGLIAFGIAAIIIAIMGIFGEGAKVWASKIVYNCTGFKSAIYKKWEKEKEQEKRKAEQKRKKELEEQLKNTPPPQTPAFTVEQAANVPDREWLIDDWLFDNDLAVLFGPPKAGKSTLAMQIARDLAEGRLSDVFPMECPRQRQWVFYYHLEMTPEEVMKDYPDLLPAKNIDYFIRPKGINTARKLVDDIRTQIVKQKKKNITVIVDNISKLGDATSDKKLLDYIGELKDDMAEKHGVKLTVILLNHTHEDKYKDYAKLGPNMMRGSENLYRQVGLLFCINNTCEGDAIKMIKMNARRNAANKKEVIVVQRSMTPEGRGCFNYLRDDDEIQLLPPKLSYKKTIVGEDEKNDPRTKTKRGDNLRLTPEQEARIVEIYHLCGDNQNAAAKAVRDSKEELLSDIEKFAPIQVGRIVKKYENQQKTTVIEFPKKMA